MAFFLSRAPLPKTWWAKQITEQIYTAGRLTETQFKNVMESGFKSILSLNYHKEGDTVGTEHVPDSARMLYLAEKEVGIHYDTVLKEDESLKSNESFDKLAKALDTAPRPTLLHCTNSTLSSFGVMTYLAKKGQNNSEFEPKLDRQEFHRRLSSIGFSTSDPDQQKVIDGLFGSSAEPRNDHPPDISVTDWYDKYWLVRPVYKNFYVIGQLRSSHFQHLKDFGFKSVFNLRYGKEWDGKPAQEEVTLSNVRCFTWTYAKTGRQSEPRLLSTRVFPQVSNSYIEEGSPVNYQSSNPLEFGDDVGYNEDAMKEQMAEHLPGVKYLHTPMGESLSTFNYI